MSLIHLPIDWRERHTAFSLPIRSGRVEDVKTAGSGCATGGIGKTRGLRYLSRPVTAEYLASDIKPWRLDPPPRGDRDAGT